MHQQLKTILVMTQTISKVELAARRLVTAKNMVLRQMVRIGNDV